MIEIRAYLHDDSVKFYDNKKVALLFNGSRRDSFRIKFLEEILGVESGRIYTEEDAIIANAKKNGAVAIKQWDLHIPSNVKEEECYWVKGPTQIIVDNDDTQNWVMKKDELDNKYRQIY